MTHSPRLTGWGRLDGVVDAAVLATDREQAKRDTEVARDQQGVPVGRDTDHGHQKIFIRAAGPDVESFDAMIDDIAAAVANAVFNATGVRLRNLPLRLENMLS